MSIFGESPHGTEDDFDLEMYYATGMLPYEEAVRVEAEILAERLAKQNTIDQERQEYIDSPNLDYFDRYRPRRPKYEIGLYVAEQGFPVPLIRNMEEWQAAFRNGMAMLRSEMPQDYDGYSGLLDSRVISPRNILGNIVGGLLDNSGLSFKQALAEQLYKGLETLEFDPVTYMRTFVWSSERLTVEAARLGIELDFYTGHENVSTWRYVAGTNIRVFRDPSVDGRYHLGFTGERNFGQGVIIDTADYQTTIMPYNGKNEVDIERVIQFYEDIRTLPRFDARQAPLIEMQYGDDGELYFLQYLKTGHLIDPRKPFEISQTQDSVVALEARGVTPETGLDMKIYICPPELREHMRGEAFYVDWMDHRRLAHQIMSTWGEIVINNTYLSLKDNHFDSSPLIRPRVALSVDTDEPRFQKLFNIVRALGDGDAANTAVYVNARIVANGLEGRIDSDWIPQYEDLR